jgi:hypothetical protein
MIVAGILLLTTTMAGAALTALIYGVSAHLEADDVRPSGRFRPRMAPARIVAYAPTRPRVAGRLVPSPHRQVSLG